MLLYNWNPPYSPHSDFNSYHPRVLKSGCNRAVLREVLFYSRSIIDERVQVDGVLQGEGLGLLDVLVAQNSNRILLTSHSNKFKKERKKERNRIFVL